MSLSSSMNHRENPFLNLLFNIVLPIALLNKGHKVLGNDSGVLVLLLALAFPVIYGSFDLIKHKRKNLISIFGILNVLLTGGFALLKLSGIWFAVKEALFPLLAGIFILISAYTKKSFFEYMIKSSPLFRWDQINENLLKHSSIMKLKQLLKKSTILFSLSFFISAVLNFFLALYIFEGDPSPIDESKKNLILNKKIADMTWMGFVVIGLPLTLFALGIFWWFIKNLSQATKMPIDEMLLTKQKK